MDFSDPQNLEEIVNSSTGILTGILLPTIIISTILLVVLGVVYAFNVWQRAKVAKATLETRDATLEILKELRRINSRAEPSQPADTPETDNPEA